MVRFEPQFADDLKAIRLCSRTNIGTLGRNGSRLSTRSAWYGRSATTGATVHGSFARGGGVEMGGWGSGKRWTCKDTTDDYRQLDVRKLQRKGWLTLGNQFILRWSGRGVETKSIKERAEVDRIVVWYRHRSGDGQWETLESSIRLDHTPCNYGRSRPWFICLALRCGRRAAILYLGRYLTRPPMARSTSVKSVRNLGKLRTLNCQVF